jgi:hypothetical protein
MEAVMHFIVFITLLVLNTETPTLQLMRSFTSYKECMEVLDAVQLDREVKSRMSCMVVRVDPRRDESEPL